MSSADEPGERRGLLPRFTLKDGDTFLLADALGDIQAADDGLFTNDTRMLSRFDLFVAGRRPSLLGAAINRDNTLFTAHLTNRPLTAPGELALPKGVIHIERSRLLWRGRWYEQLTITNFGDRDAEVPLLFCYAADFADIFEVQGTVRKSRGEVLPARTASQTVKLSYRGLDDVVRTTCIEFSHAPVAISATQAEFKLQLRRGGNAELSIEIGARDEGAPARSRFAAAASELSADMQQRLDQGAVVSTSGRLFDQWIDRSRSDLALLTTSLPTGPYPYAGIPWFATQFGRDAIITALQTLWLNPRLAAGVLKFLASTQATEDSAFRDSQPGKIMHETRRGEMAALQEVPFGRYYGGVDTTPLFVMLAGAYEKRTGDRALIDSIWDSLLAATGWIERRIAASPIGFLDYARGETTGLVNQAWKDSHDSMFHDDGRFPKGPLAVAEVQGYAYAALKCMSELATRRGNEKAGVAVAAPGRRSAHGDRRAFLGSADALLRHRNRRRRRAVPGVRIERRPSALLWRAKRRACSASCRATDVYAVLERLGHQDAGRARAALQPDVVSQRFDLAARHLAVRGRHLALRRTRQRRADSQRHLRDREPVRHAPARAVLRLPARRGPGTCALSRCMPAAGMGVGLGVPVLAGVPRHTGRWRATRGARDASTVANRCPIPRDSQPAGCRCRDRSRFPSYRR